MIQMTPRFDSPEQPVPVIAAPRPDRYEGIALGVECAWPVHALSAFQDVQPWTSSGDSA
jgi:hypothetical protein